MPICNSGRVESPLYASISSYLVHSILFYFIICSINSILFYFIFFYFISFYFNVSISRLPSALMNCGICTNRKWKYRLLCLLCFIFVSSLWTLVEVIHTVLFNISLFYFMLFLKLYFSASLSYSILF